MTSRSSLHTTPRWLAPALLAVVFLATFRFFPYHFADGHHLYPLGHRVIDWHSLVYSLTAKTDMWYRPVSVNIACGLLAALLRDNLVAINLSAVFFHLGNTVLLYSFMTRLLGSRWPALLGVLFFMTHHACLQVCEGPAFFPELFVTSFCLLAFHFMMSFIRTERPIFLLLLFLAVILGFGSKEAAVVTPFILGAGYLTLARRPQGKLITARAFQLIIVLTVPTLAYLAWIMHLSPAKYSSYFLSPTVGVGVSNLKSYGSYIMLPWHGYGWPALLAILALSIPELRKRPQIWILGASWTILALVPILFLDFDSPNFWYLYGPAAGFALVLASCLDGLIDQQGSRTKQFLYWSGMAFLALAVSGNALTVLRRSRELRHANDWGWRTYYGLKQVGKLSEDHYIYILGNPRRALMYETGQGGLINLVCGIPVKNVLYAEDGEALPGDFTANPRMHILAIKENGEVADLSESFRSMIRPQFEKLSIGPESLKVSTGPLIRNRDYLKVSAPQCKLGTLGIRYRINDESQEELARIWLSLDEEGAASYFLHKKIKPARYCITAFQCFHWQHVALDGIQYNYRISGVLESDWVSSNIIWQISDRDSPFFIKALDSTVTR